MIVIALSTNLLIDVLSGHNRLDDWRKKEDNKQTKKVSAGR